MGAPTHICEEGFRMRWKFLFSKYRLTVHWWSVVITAKCVVFNIGFVLLEASIAQLTWAMRTSGLYAIFAARYWPWRHVLVSALDIWSYICVIISASAFVWFARDGLDSPAEMNEYMSKVVIAYTVVALPFSIPLLIKIIWGQTRSRSVPYLGLAALDAKSKSRDKVKNAF